jgi:hypothetical protein
LIKSTFVSGRVSEDDSTLTIRRGGYDVIEFRLCNDVSEGNRIERCDFQISDYEHPLKLLSGVEVEKS